MKKERKRTSKTRNLSITLVVLILSLVVLCFVYYSEFIKPYEKKINLGGEIGELATLTPGSGAENPRLENLIAYYPFQNNANDASENSNDGGVHGGATFSVLYGKIRIGLGFDGINDYVTIPNSPVLNNLQALTISAWIKPSTSHNAWERIIDKGVNSSFIFASYNTTNKFGIWIGNSTNNNAVITTGALDNNWHHLAVTANGSILKIYVDSVLNNTAIQTIPIGNTNYPLAIGADMSTNPNQEWFSGSIDEVKIWNSVLNSSDIDIEYRRINKCADDSDCKAGDECIDRECTLKSIKSVVAYYEFEGNSSDSSGKENTGDVYGATFIDEGEDGQGLNFNGKDNYVKVSDSPSLRLRAYSVSVWIKPKLGNSGWKGIIGKPGRDYNIWYNGDDGSIAHRYHDNVSIDSNADSLPNSIIKGQWNHIIITNNNNISRTYINGTEKGSGTVNVNLIIDRTDLYIGKGVDVEDTYFNGTIDEIKIWNYGLSKKDVAAESNRTFNCTVNLDCDNNDKCTRDICNNITGICSYEFNNSIAGCNCNSDAACADSNACTTNTCNTQTHACITSYNSASCDDVNLCTGDGTCSLGVCGAGPPMNCSDSSACTTDSCSNGVCSHSYVGCPCTNSTQCQSGNTCVTDFCNATISRCAVNYKNIECNDTNPETIFDWCSSIGICTGQTKCNLNDTCDPSRAENCSNCPHDCGNCSSGTITPVITPTTPTTTPTTTTTTTPVTSTNTSAGVSGETPKPNTLANIIFFIIIIILTIGIFIVMILLISSMNRNTGRGGVH